MATKVEGRTNRGVPGSGSTVAGGCKERRASLVLAETAAQLAGLAMDADRSNALMAELEALLSSSQVASGSPHCSGSVFASANFTATQPLELSSDGDDDNAVCGVDVEYDQAIADTALQDHISSRRLKTLRSVGRTSSVMIVGGGDSGPDGPLLITGTSASFSSRPGFAPSTLATATATSGNSGCCSPTAAERRRSLSSCNMRLAASFSVGRSGPSQSGLKLIAPGAGPHSAAQARGSTNSGFSGSEASIHPEPSSPCQPQPAERRTTYVAWASASRSRSPTRRASRTAETPATATGAVPAVGGGGGSGGFRATSAHRRASVCDGGSAAGAVPAAAPRALTQTGSRRATLTSHSGFLPRLGRRDSDTSGSPLYGSGGGATAPSGSAGAATNGGGGGLRWSFLIGGSRSSRTLKE